ncbi:MAG TPA: homoserine kinase [Actinobacteria bacterium]|jgi:homoserine kinase|nr:homoserine kinase [Actinomycetota bacterium]
MSALRRDAVRVVVPATSANLGPAFDSAGLALSVYDDLVAMATEDTGVLVEISGEGENSLPRGDEHLVVQSMRSAFDRMGVEVPGFVLRCINAIPHGRGLGSSAAAIIGGIVLARAMVVDGRDRMTDDDVLQLALERETHPDNIAAALFGGFTVAWLDDQGRADAVRMDTHDDVRPVVLVPSVELSTAEARTLLPESVTLADATVNISRSALLVHAMTADPSRLLVATADRIHQQSRSGAYPGSWRLVSLLRESGVAAVVSGAGPSVLAFVDDSTSAALSGLDTEGWIVREVAVSAMGAREVPLLP